MSRQPDPYVLRQLYGDDSPIGSYERKEYLADLSRCNDLEDYAHAIVSYSIDLHNAQRNYAEISPYGGLDIEIEPTDKIALRESVQLTPDLGSELQTAVLFELSAREIELYSLKEAVTQYEKQQTIANGSLLQEFDQWMNAKTDADAVLERRISEIQQEGGTQYNAALADKDAYNSKPFLYRILHIKEPSDIQERMDNAVSMIASARQTTEQELGDRLAAIHSEMPYYIDPYNFDSDPIDISDRNIALQVTQAAKLSCEKHHAEYVEAKKLLSFDPKGYSLTPQQPAPSIQKVDPNYLCVEQFRLKDNVYQAHVVGLHTDEWRAVRSQGDLFYVCIGSEHNGNRQELTFTRQLTESFLKFEHSAYELSDSENVYAFEEIEEAWEMEE